MTDIAGRVTIRNITREALILSAALVASLPFASAATADPAATRVVKVLAWETQSRVTPKPPAGLAGDVVTGTDRLRNAVAQFGKPKGAVVGSDRFRIVLESANRASIDVTTTLPGGTVRCRGTVTLRRSVVISLVGGTGAYAGASGTCAATSGTAAACAHPDERQRECELNTYRIRP